MFLTTFTHPALTDEQTGEKIILRVAAEMVVCPCCQGQGRHFRSDLNESRLLELLTEEGDEQDYFDGHYDQTCAECKGRNVVEEIHWDSFRQKWPAYAKRIDFWNECEAEDEAETQAERRYFGQ